MATQAANLYVAIGADVGAALAGIRRVESAVTGMGGFIRNAASSALGFAAGVAGLNALSGAADAARGAVFGMNGTLEQQQIAFRTLLGSQERANTLLGQLQQFANTTDLTFPQITTAAQRLLGVGTAASDVIPLLTDIAGTAAAFGAGSEGVDRITRALQQMKGIGVVQLGEINQLSELGINGMQLLADHTGKSVAQIRKQLEGGKIKPEVFFAAFQANARRRGFDKVLGEQSRTLNGALSTIGDQLNTAGARAFLPFFELVREGANAFAAFTQTPAFDAFVARVQEGVRGIVQEIGTFIATTQNIANAHGLNVFDAALVALEQRLGEVFGPQTQATFNAFVTDVRAGIEWLIANGPSAFAWLRTEVGPGFLAVTRMVGALVASFQNIGKDVEYFRTRIQLLGEEVRPLLETLERAESARRALTPQSLFERGQEFGRSLVAQARAAPALPDAGTAAFGQRPITAYNAPLVQVQTVNASDPADVDAFLDAVAAELLASQRQAENVAPAGLPGGD